MGRGEELAPPFAGARPPRGAGVGRTRRLGTWLALVVLVLGTGCSGGSDVRGRAGAPVPAGWADSLLSHRVLVNGFFSSAGSPLTSVQKEDFEGLDYFPPDSTYRFVVTPDTRGAGKPVTLLDTKGNLRGYEIDSKLHLEHDGRRFTLTVFRSRDSGSLFVPFQDATTGDETYSVGRYLDLVPAGGGRFVVDFNYAMNPYCAYNDGWACPLVPPENRIRIPIRAGERTFH